MRVSLLILLVALSGCATTSSATGGRGVESRATLAANGPARSTGGGRTETVGLPLTRAQKIGLWTGVAVLLAYLMADSDDAEAGSAVEAP